MLGDKPRGELWRLYEKHRQGLYGYALSILRDPSLAEDVVHNAIVKVARTNGQIRNLRPFVFRAVRNEAFGQLRAGRKTQPLEPTEMASFLVAPAEDSPDRRCLEDDEAQLLARALARTSTEQREVIVLHVYAALKFREIAETLGEPLPTITSRYRRGLEEIAAQIKEFGCDA